MSLSRSCSQRARRAPSTRSRSKSTTVRPIRRAFPDWNPRWRLGLNIEFSLVPEGYDRSRWGNELRPIVAWENEHFEFAFDPIVDTSLAAPDWSAGPTFEPCLMAVYKVHGDVSFGLEYYTDLGPFRSGFLPLREQEHYLFEVFNLLAVKHVELNAGVGEGLTDASNRFIVKMILGYTWEKDGAHGPDAAMRSSWLGDSRLSR